MKLRILAAAYEAALGYDYCPDEDECAAYSKEVITHFTEEEFYKAGATYQGQKPSEIMDYIIEEIASLKEAQELLKTYNRWRRGEEIDQPDVTDISKAIDKLTL